MLHNISIIVGAVHITGPVTHRTIGILVLDIKVEGPAPRTQLIVTDNVLTIRTLPKTSLSFRTALPEFAAV